MTQTDRISVSRFLACSITVLLAVFVPVQALSNDSGDLLPEGFRYFCPMDRDRFLIDACDHRLAGISEINLSISGVVFEDQNANGFMEYDEPGLPGWRIQLLREGVEISNTTTNDTGHYSFSNLTQGRYRVVLDQPSGWNHTAPGSIYYDVNLFENDASNVNFGNYYGTVPDYYFDYPLMPPEIALEEAEAFDRAPMAYISPEIEEELARIAGERFSLLPYLDYNAWARNQGCCGNCWVWASMASVEISRAVNYGIRERLSIQHFNSKYRGGTGSPPFGWGCCGGTPEQFASFYNANHVAVPWANTNAGWSDSLRRCCPSTCSSPDSCCDPCEGLGCCGNGYTSVSADQIGTQPNCVIGSIKAEKIITHEVDKEIAIANIKNVLRQNKPVIFGFYLPSDAAWDSFRDHWRNEAGTAVWKPDFACGQQAIKGAGGHGVTCVGYDDTDPNNRYWIMLNSWGARSNRPDGTFLVNMDMNYKCEYPGWTEAFYWWTFDINLVEEEWSKNYGGTDFDSCYAVQQTTDGGYILGGYSASFGVGGDFWLVKTDKNGDKLWDKTFGGTDYDWCNAVQQTSDGGYILAGTTLSYGPGGYDFWLVKTDKNGNKQWDKTFGGTDHDLCNAVQQTSDGGYILAGDTQSYGAGGYDFWLVKTDKNGNKQWDKTFGGTDHDWCNAVQQTSDGGYILAGTTLSYGPGGYDFWLVKTDKNGNKQWDKTFGGTDHDWCYAVQQTSDGGYILAGTTLSYGPGGYDFWLVKTDKNGNKQWDKTFGGTDHDLCNAVQQTSDGGYILAGDTQSYGAGSFDFWLVKTDKNGNKQWDKTFGGTDHDWCYAVQQTSDGGYILAGTSSEFMGLVKVSKDASMPNRIGLRAYGGQYICADRNQGSNLLANRNRIGGWETFELINLGLNKVALRDSNGKYVCADLNQGGKLIANRDRIGGWETFDLINRGDNKIALRASNGRYVCAEGGGGRELIANRITVGNWETFRLVELKDPNYPPTKPTVPSGDSFGEIGKSYTYSTVSSDTEGATDPVGYPVSYIFDWGDGQTSGTGLIDSGKSVSMSHKWSTPGTYYVRSRATDNRGASSEWSDSRKVTMSPPAEKVSLKASNNKFVCADLNQGATLVANRDRLGSWETFWLVDLGGGKAALRASNGKYVCADLNQGGKLIANRDRIGGWETFDLENLGSSQVALRGSNGKYVCADMNIGTTLYANRDRIGGWETFTLSHI